MAGGLQAGTAIKENDAAITGMRCFFGEYNQELTVVKSAAPTIT